MVPDSGVPPDSGVVPCMATMCGTDCVDTNSTPDHCGTCNHDCAPGGCAFGACTAVAFFDHPGGAPTAIAYDSNTSNLYWTDNRASGNIFGKPAGMPGASEFLVASGEVRPQAIAVDDLNVYWATQDQTLPERGHIRYRDKALTAAVVQATTSLQNDPTSISAQGGWIYWHSNSPLHIRAHQRGTAPASNQDLTSAAGMSWVTAVTTDASNVFWFNTGSDVFKHPLNLTSAMAPTSALATLGGYAFDAVAGPSFIYWSESEDDNLDGEGRILRVSKSTGIAAVQVAQADPNSMGLAARYLALDGNTLVYTTETSGSVLGGVFKVDLSGGTPARLALVPSARVEAWGVAVVGDFVYWAEVEKNGPTLVGGKIMMIRKD